MRATGEPGDGGDVRAWLAENAADRWPWWVAFVLRGTPAKDPSWAPDIVQEGVLRMLSGDVTLPEDRKRWEAILLSTIRNVARDHCKAAKVRRTLPLDEADGRPDRVRDGWERGWRICRRIEIKRRVARAEGCLTDDQAEVTELRYAEEWTIAEIAAHRQCSPQTVKNHLRRARAMLRDKIQEG